MMDNVDRADRVMESWLPSLHEHGPCPDVFDYFVRLMTKQYEEVSGVSSDDFSRRAIRIWQDDDWDLRHVHELRDLIVIDLDEVEERSV